LNPKWFGIFVAKENAIKARSLKKAQNNINEYFFTGNPQRYCLFTIALIQYVCKKIFNKLPELKSWIV